MTLEDWVYEASPHISKLNCVKTAKGWQVSILREGKDGWLVTVREDLETALHEALLDVAAPEMRKRASGDNLAGLLE